MSGAIPLLPLYAFMAWTGTTLPTANNNSKCYDSGIKRYEHLRRAKGADAKSDSMLFQTYIYHTVLLLQKAVHAVASALNLPCNSKSHTMCFKTRQSPQTLRCATFLGVQVTRKAKNTCSFDTRHMHARNALRNTR